MTLKEFRRVARAVATKGFHVATLQKGIGRPQRLAQTTKRYIGRLERGRSVDYLATLIFVVYP